MMTERVVRVVSSSVMYTDAYTRRASFFGSRFQPNRSASLEERSSSIRQQAGIHQMRGRCAQVTHNTGQSITPSDNNTIPGTTDKNTHVRGMDLSMAWNKSCETRVLTTNDP